MNAYVTVKGEVISLSALNEEEREFVAHCRETWQKMSVDRFTAECLHGADAPLPRALPGRFLGVNLLEYPLFLILFDMHWRRTVEEGKATPEPGDDLRDPFRDIAQIGPASP